MQIKLKAETENGEVDFILTDEGLNNDNFVNVWVEGKEYTLNVLDLFQTAEVFEEIRKETIWRHK